MSKPTLKRKRASKPEIAAYRAHIRAILDDAHAAAANAFTEFIARTPPGSGQLPYGEVGYATVVVYAPAPKLRNALKALGEATRDYDGAWHISDFDRYVTGAASQSLWPKRTVCEAACAVLRAAFPDEGQFSIKSGEW